MKKGVTYIFLFSSFGLFSQNLVPNSDFEFYTSCPTGQGQVSFATPWVDPTSATSDYYNACAPASTGFGVPFQIVSTVVWYQSAYSGSAYMGVMTMQGSGSNYREYIQVQLTTPMDTGLCYGVSFYANLMNNLKKGSNNLGLYISKTAITTTPPNILNYVPQILLTGNPVITDTVNWTEISGTYIATGGEKYITIGNFADDASTTTQIIDTASGYDAAFYYIDDVSVSICSGIGVPEHPENSIFSLFPNPNNGNMTLNYILKHDDQAYFRMYDVTGRLVEEIVLDRDKEQIQINTDLVKGMYFYQVIINGRSVRSDKIIITN